MSASQGGPSKFTCDCNRVFKTHDGLKAHQRRYCQLNRPPEENDGSCPICGASFSSYMGMRQHLKLRHQTEYNKRLEAESKTTKRFWTTDEENALAKAEAEYSGDDLLEHLLTISTRSKEAIKARRKNRGYVEKVRVFKEEIIQKQQQMAANQQQGSSPQQHRTEQQAEINDIVRRDGELLEAITSIPPDDLDIASREFRNMLTTIDKAEVIEHFDVWCESLVTKYNTKKNRNKSERKQQPSPVDVLRKKLSNEQLSNRKKRALRYQLAQTLYSRDRKAYVKELLDEADYDSSIITPDPTELRDLYQNIFGKPSELDPENITDQFSSITDISSPFTADEVNEALRTSSTNTPGPDGLTLEDAKRIPTPVLLLLFNTILYLEYIPRLFKKSRTVLIPKTIDDLHLPQNWRPITISAILLRLCNKVMAKRLSKVIICGSQRGFSNIDGCFANFATIETIIKHHRQLKKPLSLISLDLAKAFDTVSHHSIDRAARRVNIDPKGRRVIAANYQQAETTIICGSSVVGTCPVNKGVKQGDPMSPIIFNIVLDELLQNLQHEFTGIQVGSTSVAGLAYADDIVLLANTPEDGQRMLNFCIRFFEKRGLMLNAAKCRSIVMLTVPGKKKLHVSTQPIFKVGAEDIPVVDVGSEFKYLGHKFNTMGLTECNSERLNQQLMRIRRAPLKPQQKFAIIKTHLIPRYVAVLQRPNVSSKVLQKVDRSIRSALKAILHLNVHCSNAVFYAPVKCGGLGIFQFSRMIPILSLSRWERLSQMSELLAETYSLSEHWMARYRRMIKEGVDSKEAVHEQQDQELRSSFSGNGLYQVKNHPSCNSYIWNAPKYWTGEDFVKAVHLRFNLLPCMSMPSVPVNQRRCRAGCFKTESLSHILQNCPLTHWRRIQRHDYVAHRLSNYAKKRGWKVLEEPHIRCTDGSLKKPDLILEKQDVVIVTDIGINWEGDITLATQYENKCAVYGNEPFTTKLRCMFPGKNIFVLPLIIGARGAWCTRNDSLIKHHLELTRREVDDLVNTTIRGSIYIHQHFMRAVWRERPVNNI